VPPRGSSVANDYDQRQLRDRFVTRDGVEVLLCVVPAEEVVQTWADLVGLGTYSGGWPVILSERPGLDDLRRLIQDASEPDLDSVSSLLEKARATDPLRFFDEPWQTAARYEENLTEGPLLERTPSRPLPPVQARLAPDSGSAVIGFFPCNDSYEIPAILAYGGWNGSPSPSEHVANLQYWQDHYDARLQCLSADTIELAVGRPPVVHEDALSVARDQICYADFSDSPYPNVGALASVLPASRHWHFW
jgi:Domain of unknown function (DUF4253)